MTGLSMAAGAGMRLGIYLHVPFCARRCDYCDFFVVAGGRADGVEPFFAWLRRDLAQAASQLPAGRRRVDSIYFGGGTPSHVPASQITGVLEAIGRLFAVQDSAEITLEANPEGVTPEKVSSWRAAGVNRLSLGIQSFHDAVLRPRGRLYTGAQACATVAAARRGGFDSLGIDLIAGLPGETPRSFLQGVDRAVELGADHVSVYLIETRESGKDTPLARAVTAGRVRLPDEEELVAMYSGAVERLTASGYHHYEISNFARPGSESRHNLKYWTSHPYLGVGPSAHSLLEGRRFCRPADMVGWIASVRAAGVPRDYTLPDAAARAREALILQLRLLDGVDLGRFAARWGLDPGRDLGAAIADLESGGLVRHAGARLALTPRGVLLSNEVFCRLA